MALVAGTRLGPYEVVSPLGAGGMGEVYRARDTRLDRTVAIKVLSSELSSNADLKARFEREARAISQLNHPNICTLHDVGNENGTDYLVMEYLEGETLVDRLRKGPLPLDQLVKIGCEIADGLDKAHRAGIVHRDLKPGNVMLTKAGAKLLDFGLAKPAAMSALAGNGSAPLLSAAMTSPSPQASPLTSAGMLVGTIQYMSPEQLQGIEADARSDIFALGAVLYEMATGKRAFEGKSQISVASAILEKDPEPASQVQPALPEELDRVIGTCLAKNPDDRFASAHDLKLQLGWIGPTPRPAPEATAAAAPRRSSLALQIAAAVVLLVLGYLASIALRKDQTAVIHAVIPTSNGIALDVTGDFAGPVVISPDGTHIAYVGHEPDKPKAIWVRALDGDAPQRLEGTDGAAFPFWSPDSRYLAFFANDKLNKVPAGGGPVIAIGNAAQPRGGTWGKDNVIVFEPDFRGPLFKVSAQGGPATQVTKLDSGKHTTHRWPWFLPDGKHFLYLATNHNGGSREDNGIYFASLDGKTNTLILPSDSGAQFASGYLLFHAQSALMAQRMDPATGKLSGEPAVVANHVRYDGGVWRTVFSASDNGILVFQSGAAAAGTRLTWYDRTGKSLGQVGNQNSYQDPRISPDGRRVAVAAGDPGSDIWVYDLQRNGSMRLTFQANDNYVAPSWSPDGKKIAYSSGMAGSARAGTPIYVRNSDGTGGTLTLAAENAVGANYPEWSADGKTLYYQRLTGALGWSIYAVPLDGSAKPRLVLAPPTPQANIQFFRISPDGRWIAYQSNESGRSEIYAASLTGGGGKWQVSNGGGNWISWRQDSKELFFLGPDLKISSVAFDGSGAQPVIGTPKALFAVDNSVLVGSLFDVSPDGQRILLNAVPPEAPSPIELVMNWPATLKK